MEPEQEEWSGGCLLCIGAVSAVVFILVCTFIYWIVTEVL